MILRNGLIWASFYSYGAFYNNDYASNTLIRLVTLVIKEDRAVILRRLIQINCSVPLFETDHLKVRLKTEEQPEEEMIMAPTTTPIQPTKSSGSYSPSIKTENFNSNTEKHSPWLKQSKPDFAVPLKTDSSAQNPVNSSHWLGALKREISEPDKPEHSIFADAEEEEEIRLPSQDVTALRFPSGDSNISGLELLSHSASHVFNLATISLDNPGMHIELPENKTDDRASTLDKLKTLGILERTENSVKAGIRDHFGDANEGKQGVTPLRRPTTPPSLVVLKADQIPDDDVKEWDILSGRGGKSNHHPGNKRFRQVVDEMKSKYRTTNVKTDKTALSKAIVDYVEGYGGRFLTRKNAKPGHYREMAKAEARKKTSQALRETKELKWKLNSSPPPA